MSPDEEAAYEEWVDGQAEREEDRLRALAERDDRLAREGR